MANDKKIDAIYDPNTGGYWKDVYLLDRHKKPQRFLYSKESCDHVGVSFEELLTTEDFRKIIQWEFRERLDEINTLMGWGEIPKDDQK